MRALTSRDLSVIACAVAAVLGACGTGGASDFDPNPNGGGDPTDDSRLSPLAVGRTWTYAVTSSYPSCPAATEREVRVVSAGTTAGRATFEVEGFCGDTSHVSVVGDTVETYFDWGATGWSRMLDEPVTDGHTWTTTNGSATYDMMYEQAGTVGGYADCWRVVQQVSYTTTWTYCRGVGLILYDLVDLGGGTIRAELVDGAR